MSLQGGVSIVTGGGRGIGRVVAKTLAAAGSNVMVVARSSGELDETVTQIEATGGRARAWTADVTDATQVEGVVRQIEDSVGPVSLLINNAGNGRGGGPLWETDPEEWWRVVEVNLRGPYLFSRYVLPGMVERGAGRIINVASHAGIRPTPFAAAYSSSKAALLRFNDCLAAEVHGKGIQVFAISPGWVWTAMTEHAASEMKRLIPGFTGIPDSDTSPPEYAAELIMRLAKGEADALSGRYIHVTDDFDAAVAESERIEEQDLLALRLAAWEPTKR